MSDMRVKSQRTMQTHLSRQDVRSPPRVGQQRQVDARSLDVFLGGDAGRRSNLSHLLDGGMRSQSAALLPPRQGEPPVSPWNPEAGHAFLHTDETWTELATGAEDRLGRMTYQDGSAYVNVNEPDAVERVQTDPNANWCATFAWDFLGAVMPGWSTQETRDQAAADYLTNSSEAVWAQVAGQQLPDGGLPVTLPVGEDGAALNFTALEVADSQAGTQPLASLEDMPVGESRAVVMRPLDSEGQSRDDLTGHWVIVERVSENEYRIHQSAPGAWAQAGVGWHGGGVYTHTFTGEDAAQGVSNYLHLQGAFASRNQANGTDRYGLVVLTPVIEDEGPRRHEGA